MRSKKLPKTPSGGSREASLDQVERMLRAAYRRSRGRGPEWARVEWLLVQTMRRQPARLLLWTRWTSELAYLDLLARAQRPAP